ncbi:hypothetical protein LTR56_022733 [Elasticomyces elasticus]|nr:hypothetical protein LTR22_025594 [Elasticomyces elasticus]KAK3621558.1 hypothetical protein LTR56_022733 [Elasticomyces elasticus]KAK4908053.1 hypothetical protein LTR49_023008 [Elasticomyces elasticus]KAK5739959.1 hypothetical protein LTS12_025097 [Elasticomyces elasticus]
MEMRSRTVNGGVGIGGVTPTSTSKVLGLKRKQGPDDASLNDQQRFTKRFNLLSIDNAAQPSSLYIPVNNPAAAQNGPPLPQHPRAQQHGDGREEELMQVDSTPTRVYIHDLDAELAEDDSPTSSHPPLVFLPDIEARLSRLPRQVLLNRNDDEHEGQQLVLYATPKSLTIEDEGRDVVRKAIIEARQRAQEKSVEEARMRQVDMENKYDCSRRDTGEVLGMGEVAHGYSVGYEADAEEDPDAMDIG